MQAMLNNEVTEERLVDGIQLISEIILEHGVVYAPILDRLEKELEQRRIRGDVITRARRHLEVRQIIQQGRK
jgi:hypothetical protein